MANVGVFGAGSWGTALSVLLHDNGHHVEVWSIDGEEVKRGLPMVAGVAIGVLAVAALGVIVVVVKKRMK